jgi:hypothetical protein
MKSLDGVNQTLALLGQAAGDAHTVGQTERCAVAHDEAMPQERASEAGAIADAHQDKVSHRRLNLEAEVRQSLSEQTPRACDKCSRRPATQHSTSAPRRAGTKLSTSSRWAAAIPSRA